MSGSAAGLAPRAAGSLPSTERFSSSYCVAGVVDIFQGQRRMRVCGREGSVGEQALFRTFFCQIAGSERGRNELELTMGQSTERRSLRATVRPIKTRPLRPLRADGSPSRAARRRPEACETPCCEGSAKRGTPYRTSAQQRSLPPSGIHWRGAVRLNRSAIATMRRDLQMAEPASIYAAQ